MRNRRIKIKTKKKQVSTQRKIIKWIFLTILNVILIYSTVCLGIVGSSLIQMTIQNKECRDVELGQNRYEELRQTGKQTKFPLYSQEEINKNNDLSVSELYYFPNNSREKKPYVIIIPGGGYFECNVNKVAFPYAAKANEAGFTAFVLGYRYGKYSSKYAPIDDLAKAIGFITENADSFNVYTEDYMIVGYSAGGNLTGLFASEKLGYKKYELPKPGTVALIYPWININRKVEITGNVWTDLFAIGSGILGNGYLLGKNPTDEEKQGVCVQNHVNSDYPPVFMVHGNKDFVVPHDSNSDVMEKALKEYNVKYKYTVYDGLNHGFGLGKGTCAENWVNESIEFWESNVN